MVSQNFIKFQVELERRALEDPLYAIAAALMHVASEIDSHATQFEELSDVINKISLAATSRTP